MCYKCFLLGASLRSDCVSLPLMANCDFFKATNITESLRDLGAEAHLAAVLQKFEEKGAKFAPIKVEGDGHCLVHSISRCIGATEHLYAVLRTALHAELAENEEFYKRATGGMYHYDGEANYSEQVEWAKPTSRGGEYMTPLHIFGLSNVLKRPIILLDGQIDPVPGSNGRGLYLPTRFSPEECRTTDGSQTCPIVISWSSAALNHYVCLAHVMTEVNQEQPIATGAGAGVMRALRTLRSVSPLHDRLSALNGLLTHLKKCSSSGASSSSKILTLNSERRLTASWGRVDGVRDFLREVGFIETYRDEAPEEKVPTLEKSLPKGAVRAVMTVLRSMSDLRFDTTELKALETMLSTCEGSNANHTVLEHHPDGVFQFLRGVVQCCSLLEETTPLALRVKTVTKYHGALLDTLRYVVQSPFVSKMLLSKITRSNV